MSNIIGFGNLMDVSSIRDMLNGGSQNDLNTQDITAQVISSSIMADHFTHTGKDDGSKYIIARKAALQADSTSRLRQSAILQTAITEAANAESYAQQVLLGKRAARRMMLEKQQSVAESSEDNLKDIQKTIEEKAEAATSSTGSAGEVSKASSSDSAADQEAASSGSSKTQAPVDIIV